MQIKYEENSFWVVFMLHYEFEFLYYKFLFYINIEFFFLFRKYITKMLFNEEYHIFNILYFK